MTDARFPERWLNDRRITRLSAVAFKTFALALVWSVANRTDGYLTGDDLAEILRHRMTGCEAELVAAGLWDVVGDGWQIADYEETQNTRADLVHLAEARRKARDKKRQQRAAAAAAAKRPGDVPGDTTRTGQDRTGSLLTEGQGLDPGRFATEPFPATQPVAGLSNGGTSSSTLPDRDTGSHQGDDRYAREDCPACGQPFDRYKSGRIRPHRTSSGEQCRLSDILPTP